MKVRRFWKQVLFAGLILGMFGYCFAADFFWVTGSESITINGTTGGLTQSKYYNATTGQLTANYATLTIESTNIRYTLDGTTPSASVGIPVSTNGTITLWWSELKNFKPYCATTATAYVTYKKYFPTE